MSTVRGHQDAALASRRPDQCFCSWGANECPNVYTHVVENTVKPGFMKCCNPHLEGYMALGATGITVWTREAWEHAGREKELLAMVAAARGSAP